MDLPRQESVENWYSKGFVRRLCVVEPAPGPADQVSVYGDDVMISLKVSEVIAIIAGDIVIPLEAIIICDTTNQLRLPFF